MAFSFSDFWGTSCGRTRRARFESLESRLLLAVLQGITESDFDSVIAQYPGFNYDEITAEDVWVLDADDGISIASLKQALNKAKAREGADLIVVKTSGESAPSVKFSKSSDSFTFNDPSPVTLVTYGTQKLTINASSKSRVLTVDQGSEVGLGGLVLTGGSSSKGGAIYNAGSLTLDGVWITSNASSGHGGGVYNEATFTAVNTIISGNRANGHGGGVYSTGRFSEESFDIDELIFVNDTITGNEAGYTGKLGLGGGIYFQGIDANEIPFAEAWLYNSIIVQNLASDDSFDANIFNYAYYEDEEDEYLLGVSAILDGCYNLTSFVDWYDVDNIEFNQIYDESYELFVRDYNFKTRAEGDYALYDYSDSQAIDGGSEDFAYYFSGEAINRDYLGAARIQGRDVDIGAFETFVEQIDVETFNVESASVYETVIGAAIYVDGIVVSNLSSQRSGELTLYVYASSDDSFDEDDVWLGEKTLGFLAAYESRVVSTGELATDSLNSDSYYYIFWQVIAEVDLDESNNVGQTTNAVYFYDETSEDVEVWSLNQDEFVVQQGCAFYVEVSPSDEEDFLCDNLSFWYDFGDGVYSKGVKADWIMPSQYVQTTGVYSFMVKIVDEDLRQVVGFTGASLSVVKTSPSLMVEPVTLVDDSVLRLNFNVVVAMGLPVNKWIIDWGDGKSSCFESLGNSLTAAHYYAHQANDSYYDVTLTIYDFESDEGITFGVYNFTSLGVAETMENFVPAPEGVYGPLFLPTKKKTTLSAAAVETTLTNGDKTKNVFEELCEVNWLDEGI